MQDVGAEDAAVGVELVDDNVLEAPEELFPLLVVGEHAGVEHVGRRNQNIRQVFAYLLASVRFCIAVVDFCLQ